MKRGRLTEGEYLYAIVVFDDVSVLSWRNLYWYRNLDDYRRHVDESEIFFD